MSQSADISRCGRCGGVMAVDGAVCGACGQLRYYRELTEISHRAQWLEGFDPAAAGRLWATALRYLPREGPMFADVARRASVLAGVPVEAVEGIGSPPPPLPVEYGRQEVERGGMPGWVKTGGSALISVAVYAAVFAGAVGSFEAALKFATGFVLLIFFHEMGHVVAIRRYGLRAGPAVFVPFLGAVINLRDQPPDARVEAVVGIAGPIAGTIAALVCWAFGWWAGFSTRDGAMLLLLSQVGFMMNLFNLAPLPPLDGGRIAAAVSPKVWVAGLGVVGWLMWTEIRAGSVPWLLLLVLAMALPRVIGTLSQRRGDDPYFRIPVRDSALIGTAYVLLAATLLVGAYRLTGMGLRLT